MEITNFVPIKRIIKIINSCETTYQLKNCLNIIDNYLNQLEFHGVINTALLRKRLMKEYNQKNFQMKMIRSFIARNNKEYIENQDKIIEKELI